MKNISTTKKITLGILLFVVAAMFGYIQLYKHLHAQQEKLVALEQELHSVDVVSEGQQEVKHFLKDTEKKREELEKYFVSLEDPTPFLEQIDSTAKAAGVVAEVGALDMQYVEESLVLPEYSKELQKEVRFILSVEGEWDGIHHFLALLEEFPYTISVLNVAFTLKDEELLGGLWEGKVHVIAKAL